MMSFSGSHIALTINHLIVLTGDTLYFSEQVVPMSDTHISEEYRAIVVNMDIILRAILWH